jgi:phage recombination protein Bet
MSEALQTQDKTDVARVELSFQIVKKYINPLASDPEIYFFMQLCKAQNLNPFLREAYLIKYDEKAPASIVVGKETFLKRANRHEAYKGFKSGVVVSYNAKDGAVLNYREGAIVLPGETLLGGWCEVFRLDRDNPIRIEVALEEYIGMKPIYRDGRKTDETEPNKTWSGKKATMIRKVSVVQAHREAFPDELGGMFAPEEMQIDVVDLPEYSTDKPQPGYIDPPKQKGVDGHAPPPADILTVKTKVEEVFSKGGEKDGKPYTKFTVSTPEGKFNTFSETFAKVGIEAKKGGLEVVIGYKTSKYGNDLQSIAIVQREAGDDKEEDMPE